MQYVDSKIIDNIPEYDGFQRIRFETAPSADDQYYAEVIAAEKTVSEWQDYLEEEFGSVMDVRQFFQYAGDSGALDVGYQFIEGLLRDFMLSSNPWAMILGAITNTISLFSDDMPAQMSYILNQIEGHDPDEKVMIVFEETAMKKRNGWAAELFHLDPFQQIHKKKHY